MKKMLLISVLVLLAGTGAVWPLDLSGKRVKVTGRWTGDHLEATRIQIRKPDKDPRAGRVEGRIEEVLAGTHSFRIGPLVVEWIAATVFAGMTPADLTTDKSVQASGDLSESGHLVATSIEVSTAEPGTLSLLGAVGETTKRADGSSLITLMGVSVVQAGQAQTRARELARNRDEIRPADQSAITLFGRPVTLGGELGTTLRYEDNFRLNSRPIPALSSFGRATRGKAYRVNPVFQIELFYPASGNAALFLEAKVSDRVDYKQNDTRGELHAPTGRGVSVEEALRGQTWLYVGDIPFEGFGVQVGRQRFREPREWWWDKDLDAVRFSYHLPRFHVEIGRARELGRVSNHDKGIDPAEDGVLRTLGQLTWQVSQDYQLDLFSLYHDDRSARPFRVKGLGEGRGGETVPKGLEDTSDANLLWFGGRLSAQWSLGKAGDLRYRVDGARVRGDETLFGFSKVDKTVNLSRFDPSKTSKQRILGWAYDGGMTWRTGLPGKIAFTAGYAVGSGDDNPDDGRDLSFRQTGLQGNAAKFRGVDSFRYYGELLRPELSNLKISTGAMGFRFLKASSLELIYHNYRQVELADKLRDAQIKGKPNGKDRGIGREWNLALGLQEWKHVEIELVGGLFRAGPAIALKRSSKREVSLEGAQARNIILKVNLNF